MAITITKRGEIPEKRLYEAKCGYCNTEYTFNKSDTKIKQIDYNENRYTIKCPLCNEVAMIDPSIIK